jgi:hypothetical protein
VVLIHHLPRLTPKFLLHSHLAHGALVQAVHGDAQALRVAAWLVEGGDAAARAEQVLGSARAKLVARQRLGATQQPARGKSGSGHIFCFLCTPHQRPSAPRSPQTKPSGAPHLRLDAGTMKCVFCFMLQKEQLHLMTVRCLGASTCSGHAPASVSGAETLHVGGSSSSSAVGCFTSCI